MIPSRGRSGGGFTIFASTCAMTRVFPSEHSTQPSSGPNVSVGVRISSVFRPSRRSDCLRELYRNSFSGIEGEGARGILCVERSQ